MRLVLFSLAYLFGKSEPCANTALSRDTEIVTDPTFTFRVSPPVRWTYYPQIVSIGAIQVTNFFPGQSATSADALQAAQNEVNAAFLEALSRQPLPTIGVSATVNYSPDEISNCYTGQPFPGGTRIGYLAGGAITQIAIVSGPAFAATTCPLSQTLLQPGISAYQEYIKTVTVSTRGGLSMTRYQWDRITSQFQTTLNYRYQIGKSSEARLMRDTRSGLSRKTVRTSQPSTSSESEVIDSKAVAADAESKTRDARRITRSGISADALVKQEELPGKVKEENLPVSRFRRRPGVVELPGQSPARSNDGDSENAESNAPSASGLRRSAREPRPKRALSPTPVSPKRRPRVKRPSTATDNDVKDPAIPGFSNKSAGDRPGGGTPRSSIQASTSDGKLLDRNVEFGNDAIVEYDMENDLVDIQPFDSGDTISEVFVTAKFTGRRVTEASVEVAVLDAPPAVTTQARGTSSAVKLAAMKKETVSEQPTSLETSSENNFDENPGSEMEPPVLDGPIIGAPTCDFKPGVDMPPTLMADGVVNKGTPKPVHYVVGEIYRVHTPNGTEQEVQLAVMDDGSEALVNANGEIVDMTPEDSYAAIDICDIEFNFLDEKNVVCGLCGEVVVYTTLFTDHLARIHPEMMEPDMMIGDMSYVDYLKSKLETDRKNIQNGFKFAKQSMFRKTPRKVSQIRINPSEMNMAQLEVALRKKLLEKMGRRVNVSLVDKEHVKCGHCNSVISINRKFEIVHVVRHFNAWHPTNHQCAGQWPKRVQRPGVGKPLSKQDFAVIDLSHTQPDNLQCIWCGMFIDATTIAVHFTDCHPGEVEVPKCLLCIQELVINARVIEKFGSDFEIVLKDEFHIKVGKLNKLYTSESLMDAAIEKYLDLLNGKRKRSAITVERRVFEGDSVVVQTTAIPGEDDSMDDLDEGEPQPLRRTHTNSRMVFGKHNKPKRSMVQPIYRQAPPTNSEYVKVINESHWKCKLCDADLYGAVISACAIRHFKLKHPQDSDSLQFEVVRARLDRISDGCMEFVHPMMLECLICHLTYQLHKPYNVCRGIRHLKSRHPEIMPEFNGEPLRRYRKTGTALRLDDDPNIPRRRRETHPPASNNPDMVARLKPQYPESYEKVQTVYGDSGDATEYVLVGEGEGDHIVKENLRRAPNSSRNENQQDVQQPQDDAGSTATDVKPGREVVFELSFDYNHLDADGKPQKHLVRVTPNPDAAAPAKTAVNSNAQRTQYVKENGNSSVREVAKDQLEANEVFYEEAHADGSATENTVMLGDVLFVDADGNEIIQRTTALEDGTIQQQYLGQAEDGSLFLLDDIVAAGLHPYSQGVEEVYDAEIIDEGVAGPSYSRVDQREFRDGNQEVEAYEGTLMHTYGAGERQNVQQQYGEDVVIDETMHYNEGEVVMDEAEYEHIADYGEHFEQPPTTEDQGNVIIGDGNTRMLNSSSREGSSAL
ncbi:unnamed protein product [Cylicocyclus nassatus]|uniref:C2H2-type domain-containing protein n=1 Tax=Cylicocyclus nassatus TaxID=53992 RepID=A0AA36M467_CYLNA|nr:unnamed protein product [Cylicocyclus nassatus]